MGMMTAITEQHSPKPATREATAQAHRGRSPLLAIEFGQAGDGLDS